MPENLMPCPFCGSRNVDILPSFGYERPSDKHDNETTKQNFCNVQCINCGAQGASRLGVSLAADAWNNRTRSQTSLNDDIIALIHDISRCDSYDQFKRLIIKARNIIHHHKEK